MALSTVTISDTMEWAKKMSFNRLSAIGNNLEPALTSANMVMQTILGPPFSWWWNNQELTFACNTTPTVSSAISNVAVTNGIVTITVNNTFHAGDLVLVSGLVTATWLNGQLLTLATANSTTVTAPVNNKTTYTSTPDTVGVLTAQTTQDYTIAAPAFSHIEHASVLDIGTTPNKWWALQVKGNLGLDSTLARPSFISPHSEDGQGNVTFRVMPAPARNYPAAVHVQLAAPLITSINQTWSPMPDYMRYIYSWGFLALIWAFSDDNRFQIANQKFTAGLLARAEGLTDEDKNIFMNNWDSLTGKQNLTTQQGTQARGV
jgi:hypothetical protein